jgi:23S rRNA U2552 (ribose-2'-O)-methylase RlmE/FtsJ
MNYCLLPSIPYNRLILEDIKIKYLGPAGLGPAGLGPVINKTLYKYLSFVKEQIDNKQDAWDKMKKNTNPYEYIHTNVPNSKQSVSVLKPLSRSFFKMVEICQTLNLFDSEAYNREAYNREAYNREAYNRERDAYKREAAYKSFHLAEGPGGFIEAMTYMRKNPSDMYYGMTLLNDQDHNVPGWRKSRQFLMNHPNVYIEKGSEGDGDLTKAANLKHCYNLYHGQMDLITGDGGFDFTCQYPNQEQVSTKLIMCQIAFGIAMQKHGGTFIVKFFDTFTRFSLELLFLLSNLYDQVYLIKPHTSRMANSEKYVVCKGFRLSNTLELVKTFYNILSISESSTSESSTSDMLFSFDLPSIFTNKIEEYNAILGQQQIDNIVTTLYMIDHNVKNEKLEHLKKKNIQKCMEWCQKFNIPYNHTIQPTNIFLSHASL